MAIPLNVPIRYEPDYHTDTIGRFADGQFLAGVVAGFREDFDGTDLWEPHKVGTPTCTVLTMTVAT